MIDLNILRLRQAYREGTATPADVQLEAVISADTDTMGPHRYSNMSKPWHWVSMRFPWVWCSDEPHPPNRQTANTSSPSLSSVIDCRASCTAWA